jgi:hypothetical protein
MSRRFKKPDKKVDSNNKIAPKEPENKTEQTPKVNEPPIVQLEKYLCTHYKFRFNVILHRVEVLNNVDNKYVIMSEFNFNSLLRKLLQDGIPVNSSMLRHLLMSNFCTPFDPFKEYFSTLMPWDGKTDYIDEVANTVETSDVNYWKMCFKKWLVATVACAIEPKVTNHTVIVLAGKQGVGKTTWIQNLIPVRLKAYYYSGVINPNNKDTLIQMSECLLINLDELESLNKSEIGDLKALITKESIRIRKPYGIDSENYIRRASFAGSVNKGEFLTDTTGNRRFLCFEVENIDHLAKFDMDKVFAQAYYLYHDKFKYWFTSDEIVQVNEQNEKFRTVSLEEEWLIHHYEPCELGGEHEMKSAMELVKLMSETHKVINPNASAKNLGMALKARGFISVKRAQRKVYLLRSSTYPVFGDIETQATINNSPADERQEG